MYETFKQTMEMPVQQLLCSNVCSCGLVDLIPMDPGFGLARTCEYMPLRRAPVKNGSYMIL